MVLVTNKGKNHLVFSRTVMAFIVFMEELVTLHYPLTRSIQFYYQRNILSLHLFNTVTLMSYTTKREKQPITYVGHTGFHKDDHWFVRSSTSANYVKSSKERSVRIQNNQSCLKHALNKILRLQTLELIKLVQYIFEIRSSTMVQRTKPG